MSLFSPSVGPRDGSRKSALSRLGGPAFLLFALSLAVFLPPAISLANEPKHSLMSKIGKLKDKLVASLGGQVVRTFTPGEGHSVIQWTDLTEIPGVSDVAWGASTRWLVQEDDPLLRTKNSESVTLDMCTRCALKIPTTYPGKGKFVYKPTWEVTALYAPTKANQWVSDANYELSFGINGVPDLIIGSFFPQSWISSGCILPLGNIYDSSLFYTRTQCTFKPKKAGYWKVNVKLVSLQECRILQNMYYESLVAVGDAIPVNQSRDMNIVTGCTLDLVVKDMVEEPAANHETDKGAFALAYYGPGMEARLNFEPADYEVAAPFVFSLEATGGGVWVWDLGNPISFVSPVMSWSKAPGLVYLQGIAPKTDLATVNWTLWKNNETFLSDAAKINYDDIDMVVNGMADDRVDPETRTLPPAINEASPGIYLQLNNGYEKNAKDAAANPIEDWAVPPAQAVVQYDASADGQLPLVLRWWKNGNVPPLQGRVRFDGATGRDAAGTVVTGNVTVWVYGEIPNPQNPAEPLPSWSPVLLKPDEYIPIPNHQPPFRIEGRAAGTTTLTATYIPAGAPDTLTFADAAKITVVKFDLVVNGLPEGGVASNDKDEDSPGALIQENSDFTQWEKTNRVGTPVQDKNISTIDPDDNRLANATLAVYGYGSCRGNWRLSWFGNKLRVWRRSGGNQDANGNQIPVQWIEVGNGIDNPVEVAGEMISLKIEGIACSSSLGDSELFATFNPEVIGGVTLTDSTKITVVNVNLSGENADEATKKNPGTPVLLNDDWDCGKVYTTTCGSQRACEPIWDNNWMLGEVKDGQPGKDEDDLMELTLSAETFLPKSTSGNVIFKVSDPNACIRLWPRGTKGNASEIITVPVQGLMYAISDLPQKIYIEGNALGRANITLEYESNISIKDELNIDVVTLKIIQDAKNKQRVFYPYNDNITFKIIASGSYDCLWDLDGDTKQNFSDYEKSKGKEITIKYGPENDTSGNNIKLPRNYGNYRKTYNISVKVGEMKKDISRTIRVALDNNYGMTDSALTPLADRISIVPTLASPPSAGLSYTPPGLAAVSYSQFWFDYVKFLATKEVNTNRLQYCKTMNPDYYGATVIKTNPSVGSNVWYAKDIYCAFVSRIQFDGHMLDGIKLNFNEENLKETAIHECKHLSDAVASNTDGTSWNDVDHATDGDVFGALGVGYQNIFEASAYGLALTGTSDWFMLSKTDFPKWYNGALTLDYHAMILGKQICENLEDCSPALLLTANKGVDGARGILQNIYINIPFLEMKKSDYEEYVRAPQGE